MTTRHKGYVVHLADDIREDDSEAVIAAIRMIKGVADVTPAEADFTSDVIAVHRRDGQWHEALREAESRMRNTRQVTGQERNGVLPL